MDLSTKEEREALRRAIKSYERLQSADNKRAKTFVVMIESGLQTLLGPLVPDPARGKAELVVCTLQSVFGLMIDVEKRPKTLVLINAPDEATLERIDAIKNLEELDESLEPYTLVVPTKLYFKAIEWNMQKWVYQRAHTFIENENEKEKDDGTERRTSKESSADSGERA